MNGERPEAGPVNSLLTSTRFWITNKADFCFYRGDCMAWTYLIIAGLFEIGWAVGLKYTEGFSRPWPSVWTAIAMMLSLWCLAMALKTIPVGTGYAIWTGIGAAGTAILGIMLFDESHDGFRILSIAVIISGIIGLKLSS